MSAALLLRDLGRHGVVVEAHGPDLVVEGPAEALSDDVLLRLRALKVDLLRLLTTKAASPEWDAADWQAYFDERASIREHNGQLSRDEAEALAFEDTVTQWLCLHPPSRSDPGDGCTFCGAADQASNTLLPVLAAGGHVWVHDGCLEPWRTYRQQQAREVLRELGLNADRLCTYGDNA